MANVWTIRGYPQRMRHQRRPKSLKIQPIGRFFFNGSCDVYTQYSEQHCSQKTVAIHVICKEKSE